jgi:hypothetical protein
MTPHQTLKPLVCLTITGLLLLQPRNPPWTPIDGALTFGCLWILGSLLSLADKELRRFVMATVLLVLLASAVGKIL